MRKDVRLGAAIGGILIAVLVVYGIVASRSHSKKKDVVLDTGKTSPAGDSVGGTDRSNTTTDASGVPAAADGSGAPAHDPAADAPIPAAPPTGIAPQDTTPVDPAPAKSRASWGALLAADNVDTYMRTSTPEAVVDAGAVGNVISSAEPRASRSVPECAIMSPAGAPTETSADSSPATSAQTHTIRSGETFSTIAREVYGDARYFKDIVKANPKVDPTRMRPGTVISLPDRSQIKRDTHGSGATASAGRRHSADSSVSTPVDSSSEYRVQSADSLYRISMKLYHSPNKVDAIYQLNKAAIGTDPARLKLNMVLKLPEAPVSVTSR